MEDLEKLSIEELTAQIRDSLPEVSNESNNPDLAQDMFGYWYNAKYPPRPDLYGNKYDGYKTDAQSVFFYTFAVQQYDIAFTFKGVSYYIGFFDGKACFCRKPFDDPYLSFPSGNALLEKFEIEGTPLIQLLEDLQDIDIC